MSMARSVPSLSHTIVAGDGSSMVPGRERSFSLQYPILSKSNYDMWAIKKKVFMKSQGIWEVVVVDDVDERQDQMTLATIFQGVSEETLLLLIEEETVKAAWDMLKMMYVSTDRIKEARMQTLKSEFEGFLMKKTESVDNFAVRLTTLVNQIRGLSDMMEENYAVKKLLCAVLSKYLQIVSIIEQFGDLKTMMMKEAIGRIKAYKERLRGMSGNNDDKHLLLTCAEWEAQSMKNRDGELGGSDDNGG